MYHCANIAFLISAVLVKCNVTEWLVCWTQAHNSPGSNSNRIRDAVG